MSDEQRSELVDHGLDFSVSDPGDVVHVLLGDHVRYALLAMLDRGNPELAESLANLVGDLMHALQWQSSLEAMARRLIDDLAGQAIRERHQDEAGYLCATAAELRRVAAIIEAAAAASAERRRVAAIVMRDSHAGDGTLDLGAR